jgi:hypothetical protein
MFTASAKKTQNEYGKSTFVEPSSLTRRASICINPAVCRDSLQFTCGKKHMVLPRQLLHRENSSPSVELDLIRQKNTVSTFKCRYAWGIYQGCWTRQRYRNGRSWTSVFCCLAEVVELSKAEKLNLVTCVVANFCCRPKSSFTYCRFCPRSANEHMSKYKVKVAQVPLDVP